MPLKLINFKIYWASRRDSRFLPLVKRENVSLFGSTDDASMRNLSKESSLRKKHPPPDSKIRPGLFQDRLERRSKSRRTHSVPDAMIHRDRKHRGRPNSYLSIDNHGAVAHTTHGYDRRRGHSQRHERVRVREASNVNGSAGPDPKSYAPSEKPKNSSPHKTEWENPS